MDFLKTFFLDKGPYLHIWIKSEAKNSRIWRNTCPYSYESKGMQKTPELDATYVSIVMNQKWGKQL